MSRFPFFGRLFENELVRRIIKHSGYLFSATGISAALSMVQGILVVRMLSVELFGILGAITMFASVVNKFTSFRMGETVVRYVGIFSEAEDSQRAAATFKLAALVEMLSAAFAFGIIWLLAPLGAQYFAKDVSFANYFIIYGLIVLANLITESSTGLLQIFGRFRRIAVLNVLQSTATLAMIIIVYLTKGGLLEILICYLGGKTIYGLGLAISTLIEASKQWEARWWKAPLTLLRPKMRELAHFATSTYVSASLSLINKDSELLWISFFSTPLEAGYYKQALALANISQMPISPLPQATYPELSRQMAKKNWKNVNTVLKQGSLVAGGYSILATIGLALLGQPIIKHIYKPELLPAYPGLLILLVGYMVANTFYWRRIALLALGHPDFPAKLNIVLASLKVIGIILLVPKFGYIGNATLLALFYIVGSIISVWKVRSVLKIKGQNEDRHHSAW